MNLSICITSCNRLKYLKSLIKSLEVIKNSVLFENVEICIVDTGSKESGIRDFIQENSDVYTFFEPETRDWINDEYKARNFLIKESKYDYLMFLQDDGQFIADDEVLYSAIKDFEKMHDCFCLEIYAVRNSSMRKAISNQYKTISGRRYFPRIDRHFLTTGIYKRKTYKEIGMYPTSWSQDRANWGRSETWYSKAIKQKYPTSTTYRVPVPMMASIWNDPRGGYAFVRGDKRYGHYLDPIDSSGLYYEQNIEMDQYSNKVDFPLSFMEVVRPLGWSIKTDKYGEMEKYSQWKIIDEDGPEEDL